MGITEGEEIFEVITHKNFYKINDTKPHIQVTQKHQAR